MEKITQILGAAASGSQESQKELETLLRDEANFGVVRYVLEETEAPEYKMLIIELLNNILLYTKGNSDTLLNRQRFSSAEEPCLGSYGQQLAEYVIGFVRASLGRVPLFVTNVGCNFVGQQLRNQVLMQRSIRPLLDLIASVVDPEAPQLAEINLLLKLLYYALTNLTAHSQ